MATSNSYRPLQPSTDISTFSSNDSSGLLTTVADLPYKFKLQYVSIETPLDLSVKNALGPITPPHSPQRSPLKKRPYRHVIETIDSNNENDAKNLATTTTADVLPPSKLAKKEVTPNGKQIKTNHMPKTHKPIAPINTKEHKRVKAVRKLKFDEKKSSPVSGTIIRALDEIDDNIPHESGDIDPQYNIVEVTEEAKAEIAVIPNVIGAYLCKLCQIEFDDAFGLARHRCSCIVLLEYRCPECGKRFNCPANLASHRRWHKPKEDASKKAVDQTTNSDENAVQYPCNLCGKFFKRQAYLRKHLATHNKPNSKTNKRNVLSATESNDGNSNSISNGMTNSGVSKSVCSDESVSSSQDSMASSIRYSFSVEPAPSVNSEPSGEIQLSHSRSPTHFRLFKSDIFTEEENIAASALAHLRHAKDSVIRHTTALST